MSERIWSKPFAVLKYGDWGSARACLHGRSRSGYANNVRKLREKVRRCIWTHQRVTSLSDRSSKATFQQEHERKW